MNKLLVSFILLCVPLQGFCEDIIEVDRSIDDFWNKWDYTEEA